LNPKLYWLSNSASGRLAISGRPRGGDWLEDEVEGWRKQGVDVVVSLLTDAENQDLELQQEAAAARKKGIRFYSFPIEDRGVPSSFSNVERLATQIGSELHQGKKVAIHCRQGIGRSSLLAAAVLISVGEEIEHSLKTIRDARGVDVPETTEQRNWLNQFAKTHAAHVAR